jgi:peptidoglycan/LPS O-acetylase OafA/YrhL
MIKSLNSFRAIAFFVVFLFHIHLLGCGYLGVQAFFVLSGFLITPILVNMKSKMNFKKYWINFMGRRFLRIFPIYYLLLIILFVLGYFIDYKQIPFAASFYHQFIYAVTYSYNFINSTDSYERNSLIAHLWSLAVEEQFYIVWPFFIFLIALSKLRKWLLYIIFIGPVIRAIMSLLIYYGFFAGVISPQKMTLAVYVLPFSYFDAFAIGGYFSLFVNKEIRIRWIFILSAFVVGLGLAINYFIQGKLDLRDLSGLGYLPVMDEAYKYIWGYTAFNLIFALILYKMKKREFFPSIFENNILDYFGKISYGLYLYHFPVIALVCYFLNTTVISIHVSAMCLVATVAVSMISYHFIELRILSFKDKLFPR